MKANEPYKPDIKSKPAPMGLKFRLAKISDLDDITELMLLVNPTYDPLKQKIRTKSELENSNDGKRYGIFVVELENKVIGFCRYFHSHDVKEDLRKYSSPLGIFTMGTIVHPNMRRMGVARFMATKRFEWLKRNGNHEVFSCVESTNLSSINMHKSFGFTEISRALGYHLLDFSPGQGILYHKPL